MDRVEFQGNIYTGIFNGNKVEGDFRENCGRQEESVTKVVYWDGHGKIHKKRTRSSSDAVLEYDTRDKSRYRLRGEGYRISLEDDLLIFRSKEDGWIKRDELVILEPTKVVDLLLEPLYLSCLKKRRDRNLIIPNLFIPILDVEELLKQALVVLKTSELYKG